MQGQKVFLCPLNDLTREENCHLLSLSGVFSHCSGFGHGSSGAARGLCVPGPAPGPPPHSCPPTQPFPPALPFLRPLAVMWLLLTARPLSPACFALIAASLSGPVAVGTQRLLQPHLGATSLSGIREREAEILCPKSAWRQFARISSLLGCVEGPGDLLAPHQSPSQAGSPQGCHLRSKIRRRAWMWHMDVKHQETFAWCVIFKIRAV